MTEKGLIYKMSEICLLEEVQSLARSTFLNHALNKLLGLLDIANKVFQSRTANLLSALNILNSIRKQCADLRNKYTLELVKELIVGKYCDDDKRTVMKEMQGAQELRRVFFEALDLLDAELNHRFSKENTLVWAAMDGLVPTNLDFLSYEKLLPLFNYIKSVPSILQSVEGRTSEDLFAEFKVFKEPLIKTNWSTDKYEQIDLNSVAKLVDEEYSPSAIILNQLYGAAITAGYS